MYSISLLQCGAPLSLLEDPAHAGTEVLSDEDPELSKISSFMSAVGQNMVMWYLPCLELYVTPR